jgi:hypothetical protein
MEGSRFKDVSTLLRAFFDEERLRRGGQYSKFFSSWKEIVGERLASHSRVGDIEKGILVVEVEHPGWIQLLQLRQSEILQATCRRFPELELHGIVFRLWHEDDSQPEGGNNERHAASGKAEADIEATSNEATSSEAGVLTEGLSPHATIESISDKELRKMLLELKHAVDGG